MFGLRCWLLSSLLCVVCGLLFFVVCWSVLLVARCCLFVCCLFWAVVRCLRCVSRCLLFVVCGLLMRCLLS